MESPIHPYSAIYICIPEPKRVHTGLCGALGKPSRDGVNVGARRATENRAMQDRSGARPAMAVLWAQAAKSGSFNDGSAVARQQTPKKALLGPDLQVLGRLNFKLKTEVLVPELE